MSNIKYFCLHHPLLVERFEPLNKKLLNFNLQVKWVTDYLPDQIELPVTSTFKNISEYSLYLKHLFCFTEQINQNIEYIVVLEDDVILPDDFNEHIQQCISEFNNINGDLLFLGICCGIQPSNIIPNKKVYWEPTFLSRCAHCYLVPLKTCKIIYQQLLTNQKAFDFKLNDIIIENKLKSCYAEPGIHQGSQGGLYKTSLNN